MHALNRWSGAPFPSFVVKGDTTPNPAFAVMVTHLEAVAVELFASYGLPAELGERIAPVAPGSATDPAIFAAVGFVGNRVRGGLSLLATNAAVAHWLAVLGDPAGDVADALGEFANMLLGRLKVRLLTPGLPLEMSIPITASGQGLRLSLPPAQWESRCLRGCGWELTIRLDAAFDEGFALEPRDGRSLPAEAGDAIFF